MHWETTKVALPTMTCVCVKTSLVVCCVAEVRQPQQAFADGCHQGMVGLRQMSDDRPAAAMYHAVALYSKHGAFMHIRSVQVGCSAGCQTGKQT